MDALLIDDERLARRRLRSLLASHPEIRVVGEAASVRDAKEAVRNLKPDVVFLDVQMPGASGFALLEDGDAEFQTVFVTAYDEFAAAAFDASATDYLLKPVDHARLELAVDRVRRRIGADGVNNADLEKIIRLVAERQSRRELLAIKVGERFLLVQAEEIIYASLADEGITVVTGQHAGTSNYRTLDDLHDRLDPTVFWRVHRSHLVNINKIKEIVPWFSRNYILRMKDEKSTEIPVSRAQTRRLREYLKL
jgi:two-component system, LytTR family, response regulator LytT